MHQSWRRLCTSHHISLSHYRVQHSDTGGDSIIVTRMATVALPGHCRTAGSAGGPFAEDAGTGTPVCEKDRRKTKQKTELRDTDDE